MAYGEDRADVFVHLIRDHKEAIIRQMDIDTILDQFPYKECISESEFRTLTTQTDSVEKSKLFVNILLNKKKERVLEAFLQLVKQSNPRDVLWLYLRDRFSRFEEKKEESNPDATSEQSIASASIYNESKVSSDSCPVRTKDELEEEIKTARTVLNHQIEEIERLEGVNSRLQEEVGQLKTERYELQSENAELRKDMDTLQRQNNDLDRQNSEFKNHNSELKAQLEQAKTKIDEFECALHSNTEQIEDLNIKFNTVYDELKRLELLKTLVPVQETKSKTAPSKTKSKICSLM
ncbi:zygote defective protein 12-like [Haliotis asinina]|uniref:zygote defective protein 12-like n=1 Tax=Haliotis asinina TaxID=109174 RepID=UPI0035317FEB